MKVIVNAGALALAASGASETLARKADTIPILGYIRIEAQGGRLVITATNLDEQISVPIDAEIEIEGVICVPGKQFVRSIGAMDKASMVSLELESGGTGPLIAKCGRSRLKLPVLPAADFPNMVTGEPSTQFAVPFAVLASAFNTVAFAISDEETRYYLNGVFWSIEGENLWFAATNGHQLAAMPIPAPDGAAGMADVIIPKGLVRRLGKMTIKGDVTVAISSRVAHLTLADGSEMISKLVDGTFPDWRRVVPPRAEIVLSCDIGDFEAAIARVTTVGDEKVRGLRVEIEADKVRLSARSQMAAEMDEEVPCAFTGKPITLGLNAAYLRAQLAVLTGETVRLHVGAPQDPILIEGSNDDARFVLMPMRA